MPYTYAQVLMLLVFRFVHWFHEPLSESFRVPPKVVVVWILATPVQFYCGLCFFRVTVKELRHCALGMSTLVVTGSLISYVVSLIAMVMVIAGTLEPATELTDFFETSAMLVTFILLGKWLEARAKAHTGQALEKLMNLQANTGMLLVRDDELHELNMLKAASEHDGRTVAIKDNNDASEPQEPAAKDEGAFRGQWVEVDINLLQVNDIVKVLPGSIIPADGTVVHGTGSVDESMLTGESVPVHKNLEDNVFGATANLDGMLFIKVTNSGDASVLSQIVTLVEDAQAAKAPIQVRTNSCTIILLDALNRFANTSLTSSASCVLVWSIYLGFQRSCFVSVCANHSLGVIRCLLRVVDNLVYCSGGFHALQRGWTLQLHSGQYDVYGGLLAPLQCLRIRPQRHIRHCVARSRLPLRTWTCGSDHGDGGHRLGREIGNPDQRRRRASRLHCHLRTFVSSHTPTRLIWGRLPQMTCSIFATPGRSV